MKAKPVIKINRVYGLAPHYWYVDVWWDDGDDTGHGVGTYTRTRWGAKRAARRIVREATS